MSATAAAPVNETHEVALSTSSLKLLHALADTHVKALQAKVKEKDARLNDKLFLEIADAINLRNALMAPLSEKAKPAAGPGKAKEDDVDPLG